MDTYDPCIDRNISDFSNLNRAGVLHLVPPPLRFRVVFCGIFSGKSSVKLLLYRSLKSNTPRIPGRAGFEVLSNVHVCVVYLYSYIVSLYLYKFV